MEKEKKQMEKEPEQEPKIEPTQSTRKTMYLIIFLAVISILLIWVAIYNKTPNPPATKVLTNNQQILSYAHTVLRVNPPVAVSAFTNESSVLIDTGSNKISGVELQMSYDPKFLQNVDVKAGTFLLKPLVLTKKIDSQKGTITFTLGITPGQKGVSGKGTIAVINFSTKPNALGKTAINFLPQTVVTDQSIAESVVKEMFGNAFTLPLTTK